MAHSDQDRLRNLEFAVAALIEAVKAVTRDDRERAREQITRSVQELFKDSPNVTLPK